MKIKKRKIKSVYSININYNLGHWCHEYYNYLLFHSDLNKVSQGKKWKQNTWYTSRYLLHNNCFGLKLLDIEISIVLLWKKNNNTKVGHIYLSPSCYWIYLEGHFKVILKFPVWAEQSRNFNRGQRALIKLHIFFRESCIFQLLIALSNLCLISCNNVALSRS